MLNKLKASWSKLRGWKVTGNGVVSRGLEDLIKTNQFEEALRCCKKVKCSMHGSDL